MAERPKLPYVDLLNFKGLYTKSSPDVLSAEQLRVAENCDFFNTYGALAKTRGNSRILTSQYKESGTAKAITWIDFYKTSDLDGQILRHTLVAAGTTLGRVENSAITTLKSGRTADLFHSSARLDKFMYITNQDPDLVGKGDDLVKYDGAVITDWGVVAPGGEETIIDTFPDTSGFTNAFCDIEADTTTTFDGDSMKIDSTGGTSGRGIFYVEKQYTPFYVVQDHRGTDKSAANRVSFFTYIPRGQLTADCINSSTFNTGEAAMAVWMSGDADTVENNHWKFYFQIGDLVEGWNKLNLNFAGSPQGPKGNFYPEVDTVKRVRWDFRLGDRAHTRTGIRLDKFIVNDQGTPVGSASGTGSLTGNYKYKITYVSKYGHESNAGPTSGTIAANSNLQIDLTKIPISPDLQVTARRIYRTVANGSVFLFIAEIPNNTSTAYTDNTTDGNIGVTTPPQAGDFSDDNSPPPQAGIVHRWKRTLFMAGDPQNPEILYFSEDNEPESFPLLNAFELDSKITAMYETISVLIVETETGKWQVTGDNPDFSVDKIVDDIGCVGRRAAGVARKIGFAVDRDGMRMFDGLEAVKISEPIRDKYDTLAKQNIELMHVSHSRKDNTILQFNPDSSSGIPEYDGIFQFAYTIDDPLNGYWSTLEIPSAPDLNILDTVEIEDSNGDFHLYATGDDGMVYELFEKNARDWVSADGSTTAIKTKFRTPYLRLGELGGEIEMATARVRPRFVEIRVRKNTAIDWTVTLESADGSSQELARDTQTETLSFGTNNSLVRQAIRENFIPGEYLRITLENEEKNVECVVTGIRIYFHVMPFEGQQISVDNSATGPS